MLYGWFNRFDEIHLCHELVFIFCTFNALFCLLLLQCFILVLCFERSQTDLFFVFFSCVFFFAGIGDFGFLFIHLFAIAEWFSYLYSNLFFCIRIGPNRNKNKIYLSIVCVFGWVEFNVKMNNLPYSV